MTHSTCGLVLTVHSTQQSSASSSPIEVLASEFAKSDLNIAILDLAEDGDIKRKAGIEEWSSVERQLDEHTVHLQINAQHWLNTGQEGSSPDLNHANAELEKLSDDLALDLILVNAPPGLNPVALSMSALSDAYLLVTSADDERATENLVMLDLMRSLGVPKVELLVTNHPSEWVDEVTIKQFENLYRYSVAALLPN